MINTSVTMRELAVGDCLAVHAFASLPEACRFQVWGPNTWKQTRDFVQGAVNAWLQSPRRGMRMRLVRTVISSVSAS